jgi:hypothetical protein
VSGGSQEFVFERNVDRYQHYRILGVSGATDNSTYISEIEFEISGVPYEKGDRQADIAVSSNIALSGGKWATLFDNLFTAYSPAGAPTWDTSVSATGKYITWSFPKPVLLASLFWQSGKGYSVGVPSTSGIDLGLWDLYGSSDNAEWVALANNINRQIYGDVFVDTSANLTPYQFYKLVPQGPNLRHRTNNLDDNVMAEFLFDITPTSSLEVTFRDDGGLSVEGPVQSVNLQSRLFDEGQLTLDSDALVVEAGTGPLFAVSFTDESKLNVTPKIVGGTSGGVPIQTIVNRS